LIGAAILCSPIAWYQYAVMIAALLRSATVGQDLQSALPLRSKLRSRALHGWRLSLCSFEEACRTSLRLGSFWELVFSNYEKKAKLLRLDPQGKLSTIVVTATFIVFSKAFQNVRLGR
jgi:hypothetical protein